ncbi:hypothetical protein H8959_006602 [Pygathrix nigripes]
MIGGADPLEPLMGKEGEKGAQKIGRGCGKASRVYSKGRLRPAMFEPGKSERSRLECLLPALTNKTASLPFALYWLRMTNHNISLTITRLHIVSPSMTIMWPSRTSPAVLHFSEGLGSIHMAAVGSRHPQDKTKLCPKRKRWRSSQMQRHREAQRRTTAAAAVGCKAPGQLVNADHDLYCNTRRSVEAPTERPGERRQAEMKRLYWDSAAKIQAMEATVQLSFDTHCDPKQPKYWPAMPLKF